MRGGLRTSWPPREKTTQFPGVSALMIPWFNHNTVTIHNQETAWEDELFKTGQGEARRMYDLMKTVNGSFRPSGRSSLQTFLPKLSGADNVLLVHNTFTRQEDINFARSAAGAQSIHWCLCPNANLYIENELPPVQLLRKNKCKIVLGTDSLASNRQLSILEEIKTIRELDPSIPEREILAWATLNGAEALGMQARFGSFDTGKKPGLILLENKDSHQILPDTTVRRIL